jgi:outer membrane protein assembly factor BamD (BamD/ComL family)
LDSAYPRHDLSDDILYKRAEIAIKMKEYSRAITLLEQLLKEYGSGIWGDNALYTQAQIHERYLNKPTEAVDLYTKLLLEYSGSFFTTEARKKIRLLRGEQIN